MRSEKPTLTELAMQLQLALEAAREENEQLTQRIQDAEERAKASEMHITEIQEKLSILESLKTKEYQKVVTELFEEPSKRAVRLTLIVAVCSIIIGLTQTVVSNWFTESNHSKTVAGLGLALKGQISEEIEKMKQTQEAEEAEKREQRNREAQRQLYAKAMPGLRDLQNNTPVYVSLASQRDEYFSITIPPNTPKLQFTLTSTSGDADLSVYYFGPPNSQNAPDFQKAACSSAKGGTAVDECIIDRPAEGDWFVRVHGFGGPSQANLRVVF
jgi:Bacterial pre-peptidase C-terminal domain